MPENLFLYADDTSLIIKNKSLNEVLEATNNALSALEIWFLKNGLILNKSKTKILFFKTGQQQQKNILEKLQSKELQLVESHNFLGLNFDKNMKWEQHIKFVTNKMNSLRYALGVLRQSTSLEICMTVYHACVESILRYGVVLWGAQSRTEQILLAQKSIIRVIAQKEKRASCRELFKEMNILTFPGLYILEIVKHGIERPQMLENFTINHGYETRKNVRLNIPKHNSSLYEHSPLYMSIKIINKLNIDLSNINKNKTLANLKDRLIKKSYYNIREFFDDDREEIPK